MGEPVSGQEIMKESVRGLFGFEREELEGKMNLEGGWLGREGGGDGVEIGFEAVGRRIHRRSWTRVRGRF